MPDGLELTNFADAVLGDDEDALDRARAALAKAVGGAGLVDAAAVVASFNSVVRVADGSGIPLEAFKQAGAVAIRSALGSPGD